MGAITDKLSHGGSIKTKIALNLAIGCNGCFGRNLNLDPIFLKNIMM